MTLRARKNDRHLQNRHADQYLRSKQVTILALDIEDDEEADNDGANSEADPPEHVVGRSRSASSKRQRLSSDRGYSGPSTRELPEQHMTFSPFIDQGQTQDPQKTCSSMDRRDDKYNGPVHAMKGAS
ncbi:hypothetical protein LA080_008063 [Diaporthe eres]|nr:hypothetical protein LA080_008063 [Diaporthe eres]